MSRRAEHLVRFLLFVALATGGLLTSPRSAGALATVNMDEVVVQAQIEPINGNSRFNSAGVSAVQSALRAEGFGTIIDGWYGVETRADYASWQRRLGYSGNDANGIPGPSSLTALGEGRFTLARRISVGPRVSYSGVTLNDRTRDMLVEADRKVAWGIDATKGSYVGCDGNSACTHAFGGAVDISVSALSTTQRWRTVKALREVGFAAWLRTPSQGFAYHIHAIAIGDTDMHLQAADQVADHYRGLNGLASHAPDNTPSEYRVPFTWWEAYLR